MVEWMDGWVGGWMCRWMDGWIDGWMGEWKDGWVGGLMEGWIDGWVDGCIGTASTHLLSLPNVATEPEKAVTSTGHISLNNGPIFKIQSSTEPAGPAICF